jgi:chemotaxis protein methyltransferase CheR
MMNAAIDQIAGLIQDESLLAFKGHKREFFLCRVEERMHALSIADMASYGEYLRYSPYEKYTLLELVTINETSFFRNQPQFSYLMETIIPLIEKKKGEDALCSRDSLHKNRLRILCAGCSTGEEPYSIAMSLLEALRFPSAWDISIVAGDLSEACLMTARDGWYHESRLKSVPAHFKEKYMTRREDGWRFTNEISRMIEFSRLNIRDFISNACMSGDSYDIIFCRNVMIYFPPETQQKLIDVLYQSVFPGGYLFTGDAEPLHLYEHNFRHVEDAACLIYLKPENLLPLQQANIFNHTVNES